MLDIQFIRDNKDVLRFSLERRGATVDLDALEKVDDERKNAAKDATALEAILPRWRALMLTVPNVLDISVPSGKPDEQMFELRNGEGNTVSSDIFSLHTRYQILTVNRNPEFSSRRYVGAGLDIYNFLHTTIAQALNGAQTTAGIAPLGVTKDALIAAHVYDEARFARCTTSFGSLPEEAYLYALELVYGTTHETIPHTAYTHGLTATLQSDEVLPVQVGDAYGVIRVCDATHQASVETHEQLTKEIEQILITLGIGYRLSVRTALYTPSYAVKSYHLAVSVAGTFIPFCDIAYMHDFLSRRLGVKIKTPEGKTRFAHMACVTNLSLNTLVDAFISAHVDAHEVSKRSSTGQSS